jgi:hypothetical protein
MIRKPFTVEEFGSLLASDKQLAADHILPESREPR